MSGSWLDDYLGEGSYDEDGVGAFYCPYTNGAECALMTQGWQPQELCHDLECKQLKFVKLNPKKRKKAA